VRGSSPRAAFWASAPSPVEIDAAALAGRSRMTVVLAEAKWARRADGDAISRVLARAAAALPRVAGDVRFARRVGRLRDEQRIVADVLGHVRPRAVLVLHERRGGSASCRSSSECQRRCARTVGASSRFRAGEDGT
jgi:hypothetical protein